MPRHSSSLTFLLLAASTIFAQTVRIEDHLPAVPKDGSYGCTVTEITHSTDILNAKNKKVEHLRLPSEYALRLFVKDGTGKETWSFAPPAYSDEDEALDDCKRWRVVVRHSLKIEEPKNATN